MANEQLLQEVLSVAHTQLGIRERSRNRGPEVDQYLRRVGLDPEDGAYSWCAAFVYWCFSETAKNLGVPNPCIKTAGVLRHWQKAPKACKIQAGSVASGLSSVYPGSVFIQDHGKGKGHTGLVVSVEGDLVRTIEGNTNRAGSREGDGVYEKTRPLSSMLGFVDYSKAI